jgi:heat shock protein HslJ
MRRPTLLVVLVFMTTMVSACSMGSDDSPPAPALADRTFLSTEVHGMALVPGSRIRLAFDHDEVSASGGCNTMGGPYKIAGDRFSAPELVTTDMGCEAPLMQQDQWLANLLGNAKIAQVRDTLVLGNDQVTLTLGDREAADPDRPIAGTMWVLDSIVDGPTVSSVPAGVTASMQIVGGQLQLNAGCNIGGGAVAVTADTLTFGPLMLTKRACQPGPSSVEEAVTKVLAGSVDYTLEADRLTIVSGGSNLVFRAAP